MSARQTWRAALAGVVLAGALLPRAAAAQVGYPPDRSPYEDAPFRQGLTTFTGFWIAGRDPAGVAPGSAPLIGARYDFTLGSAGSLFVRQQVVLSSRDAIDPTRAPGQRALGEFGWPLSVTDVGFRVQLTGQKSRKRIIPTAALGLGVVSDLMRTADIGGYAVGSNFTYTGGLGAVYVLGPRWRANVDASLYVHRFRYPQSYFAGTNPVLTQASDRGGWRQNAAITAGLHWTVLR